MSSRSQFCKLLSDSPHVLPSMLLCDFGNLASEIEQLEAAGAKALHLDVMDGHFVPNLTYGMTLVEAMRKLTDLPLDAHLMISNPEQYAKQFVEAGADCVTIHIEATNDPAPVLEEIRSLGAAAGLALNPPTQLSEIEPYLGLCDMVLVMGVMPGFGGQQFDEVALTKLNALRMLAQQQGREDLQLQVDGGVNDGTIAACAAAGAGLLVVGSGIFKHDDYSQRMEFLERTASDAYVPIGGTAKTS